MSARIETLRRAEVEADVRQRTALETADRAEKSAQDAKDARDAANAAKDVLEALAELKRSEVSSRIEGLTTKALRAIFSRDYRFRFEWSVKRGVAVAEPILVAPSPAGEFESEILDGHGGGIADVVSFILRFVVASHADPPLAKILVLDEPFRHVDAGHMPAVAEMVSSLMVESGWRLLAITHDEVLAERADRTYRVSLGEDGRSRVEEE